MEVPRIDIKYYIVQWGLYRVRKLGFQGTPFAGKRTKEAVQKESKVQSLRLGMVRVLLAFWGSLPVALAFCTIKHRKHQA